MVINNSHPRLLILPSWYPKPDDKINGSFFQEQAKLVSDRFDVKVLMIRFVARPAIRTLLKTPVATALAWLSYAFKKRTRSQLPDDEIFQTPLLIEYSDRERGFKRRSRYEKRMMAYLAAFDELLATGWRPDIIHAHSVQFGGLVARRAKEVYGIPYVITEHMPFALNNYQHYMHADIKNTFNQANVVLSLSYDKVRQLGMSGIDVEPNLIYNLVDESEFSRVCESYQPGMPLQLISIGAASYFKDHRTMLRALMLLKERLIPFKLTLVGLKVWGDLYKETLDFIEENNLLDDITVIDRIDRKNIPEYLAANQVFMITSIAEGLPVSVLEAMACGLFVVATRHGGTEDILNPESGVLVEIKNYRKIADSLEDIYRGNIRWEPQTIRKNVVSLCGTEAFARRLSDYYEHAMGEHS
jgi:glycosyltransferase involved in cell wall biosynthesis